MSIKRVCIKIGVLLVVLTLCITLTQTFSNSKDNIAVPRLTKLLQIRYRRSSCLIPSTVSKSANWACRENMQETGKSLCCPRYDCKCGPQIENYLRSPSSCLCLSTSRV